MSFDLHIIRWKLKALKHVFSDLTNSIFVLFPRDTSDTSESLNFISPSSTREDFTAGIAERCRKLQQPGPLTPKLILNQPTNQRTTTTAYFDINSGKINTILSRAGETNGRYSNGITSESFLSTKTIELQSPTVVAHANKKPSYLNLACCVNGYSNYTNYVSIERKEINKSREVSPIRPIISTISMSRQQRSSDNLLSVPTPVTFVKQSPLTSITKRFASLNISDQDTTDNASMVNGNGAVSNRKSFIQQRVEKLYGTTKILTTVKTTESIQVNGNGTHLTNGSNGKVDEKENDEVCLNSLPVMKHLRPEFCKQLQFLSSPKKSLTRTSNGNVVLLKSDQINNDQQQFKPENGISGNTSITLIKPITTKDISIDLLNSESVKNDCKNLVSEVVITSEQKDSNEPMVVTNNCEANSSKNSNFVNQSNDKMETQVKPINGELKDGNYFLRILNAEKTRILKLADDTEKELFVLQSSVSFGKISLKMFLVFTWFLPIIVLFFFQQPSTTPSEEMLGVILAAIGKSRLLATKKFKQFEGKQL